MELYEKVYVSEDFLESDHGDIGCAECHGGNPDAEEMAEAHEGVVRDPSFADPVSACGDCHEDEVESIENSLHYSLRPYWDKILTRASTDESVLAKIKEGYNTHCTACHSSCGQCHVSRPDSVEGGFVKEHLFVEKPDLVNQCTACHGSRKGNAFLGAEGYEPADVHYIEHGMDCISCHSGDELHAAAPEEGDRLDVEEQPTCQDCHEDVAEDGNEYHRRHVGKLQCQICHAQSYINCQACHIGKDAKGLPYYKNRVEWHEIKIAKNPEKSDRRPYEYALVRHVPVHPGFFDFYVKGGFPNFDKLITWKYASPHNIRKRTEQSRSCNSCHGNRSLFLTEEDLKKAPFAEADRALVVKDDEIPPRLETEGVEKAETALPELPLW